MRKIKTEMFRLVVTESCNAKCKYCLAANTPKNGCNQTIEAVEKAARKAKENGAREASISGGEPTLDKNLLKKIRVVAKYFDKINLQTNGTLLENPEDYKLAGVTTVIINLPSYDKEIYESLVGIKKYDKVIKNIIKAVQSGLNLRINSVLVKGYTDDYAHIMRMIEFSKKLGLTELTFTQLVPANEFAEEHRVGLENVRQLFQRSEQDEDQKFHSIDVFQFLDMTIGLSSCPFELNEQAFETGWSKEYVLTEDSRLVTDYFNQEQSTMEVFK